MDINVATNISKEYKNIEVIINAPEITEEVTAITNNNGIIKFNKANYSNKR